MSIRRKTLRLMVILWSVLLVAGLLVTANTLPAAAQSTTPGADKGQGGGPFVILGKEFWEAMEKMSRSQGETYGDRQEPLLEKIAISSQFVVKTNLTIIKQNERIIQLLEELNRNTQSRNVKQ